MYALYVPILVNALPFIIDSLFMLALCSLRLDSFLSIYSEIIVIDLKLLIKI